MPPILGTSPFHATEMIAAEETFHRLYGKTLAQWARIEERLFYWFWPASGMKLGVAREVFYSARNFNGRSEMLEGALKADPFDADVQAFIKAAVSKAVRFNNFRNTLAHGEPTFDTREGSPTFKEFLLLQGKKMPEEAAETAVTLDQLNIACENFRKLAKLLMDVLDFLDNRMDPTIPTECLRQVLELPNLANSETPAPKRAKQ
jgi:hypothetical protein